MCVDVRSFSDCGSPREQLERDPEYAGLVFSRLTPDWTSKQGFWAPDPRSLANRAKAVRHFLRDRPEKNIVLVGHGDVLREITCSAHGPSSYMWRNVEVQIFEFDSRTVDREDCFLKLTEVVEAAGGYGPTSTDMEAAAQINGSL